MLDAVRRRGYSIALEADARKRLGHALDDLASDPSDDRSRDTVDEIVADLAQRDYQLRDLDPARSYDVSMIAAPIFGPAGEVALAFTLLGFGAGLPGSRDRRLRRAPPRHRPRHHQTHPRPRPLTRLALTRVMQWRVSEHLTPVRSGP